MNRFRYFIKALITVIVTFSLTAALYFFVTKEYARETKENVVTLKKNTLKYTVNNFVTAIRIRDRDIRKVHPNYTKKQIQKIQKKALRDYIHHAKFNFGSYIWINEIHNFNGGNRYAKRLIHPELPKTEGQWLSTNTKDVKGQKPYQMELSGVKKHTSFFYSYYFKDNHHPQATPKLTYAYLYKDYNWIICMGVSLNDIHTYVERIRKTSDKYAFTGIAFIELLITLFFAFSYHFDRKKQRQYFAKKEERLQSQIDYDYLTKAYTRNYGEKYLSSLLLRHISQCAVFMIDIDDFKLVNDHLGHKAGDEVLIQVVEKIKSVIRFSDVLFRYGGDEFVCVIEHVDADHAKDIALKMKESVHTIAIEQEVTVSIGLTMIKETDQHTKDIINRADQALYQSKSQGKDRISVL